MNYPIPTIVHIDEKRLSGKKAIMSLVNNSTPELWKSFMIKSKEIEGYNPTEKYSISVHNEQYFKNFSPHNTFEKWAASEFSDVYKAPQDFEEIVIPAGIYAVFHYIGSSSDPSIFQYIFTQWLPASGYTLDNRPHFEVLGEKYKNNDPNSEEDIYIPIQPK